MVSEELGGAFHNKDHMIYLKDQVDDMIKNGLWELQDEIKTEIDVSVRFEEDAERK